MNSVKNKLDELSEVEFTIEHNQSLKEDIVSNLEIESIREGEIPGTHIINYNSNIDSIQIKHEAHNRNGFAFGAVLAAEWITNKKGVFEMSDVLNLKK